MKKHSIIPYFLMGFLTVVILLVGHGVGIALSYSFQTPDFLELKKSIGIVDFISGADLLFSAFFFKFYFIGIGINHLLNKNNSKTIVRSQLLLFFILILIILFLNPYLSTVDITSSFMIFAIIVYAMVLRINLDLFQQVIGFESSIDLVFYNFIQALIASLLLLIIFFLSSWTTPINLELYKLFILTYLFSFFCLLAGTLPFYSLNKIYYHSEN